MQKKNSDRKIYNLMLDPRLIKRLDHLKIDLGITRQELINRCLRYSLDKIDKNKRVKKRIVSPS